MIFWVTPALAAIGCDPASVADGLVVNEVMIDPEGTDPGLQWVELYNETGLDLDASGWRIEAGTSTYDTATVLPGGTFLIDGEYLVIAQSALPFANLVLPGFVAGSAALNADALRLVDCAGAPVDTLVYGANNVDGWLDDNGVPAVDLAPVAPSGQTLARFARSWAVSTPTPGGDNDLPPVHCGGPGSGLVINEVFADGAGWVELLHTGAAPVLLEGWSIALGTTGMRAAYTFEAGQVASPGARIVVGEAPEAAYVAVLPLAGASAVRVQDCAGFAADTVVIGSDNPMGWVGDSGGATALAPGISRSPDGVDTDDSSVDFAVLTPTPATENGTAPPLDTGRPPLDTGSPPEDPPADTAPPEPVEEAEPPKSGCDSAPGPGWLAGALALLVRGTRSRRRC